MPLSMSFENRKKRADIVRTELNRLHPEARMILQYSNHWELLVAVMLSAQCTDVRVNIVTRKLFKKYKTIEEYANADPKQFAKDIFSCGYHHNKTKNVIAAAQYLLAHHNGKLPKSMEEMILIPGVGRKTANVVLGNAYGIAEGIAVDTHVKRLARKFGLTKETSPDKIEKDLMQLIPKEEWFDFTYKIIEYGRTHSPARLKAETDPICLRLKENGFL